MQGLVAGLFLVVTIQPSLAVETVSSPTTGKNSPAVQLTRQLEELERVLPGLRDSSPFAWQTALNSQEARFQAIQRQLAEYFKHQELLLRKEFSGSDLELVLSRQEEARQQVKQRFEQIYQALKSLQQGQAAPAELSAFRRQLQGFLGIKHQPLNPQQLPIATLALPKPALAGEYFTHLSPQPQPQDLAPTPEAAFSDPVKSLVEKMQGDPQKLYQWVCNRIDYRPGYGSMQGAELTMRIKAGNAWDQASVLIALLREAGVPARYAYGRVQPTPEQLLGWLGVNSQSAAYQLLDQAGVPWEGSYLAHVWVKAYLAREGRWVDLDPSFKQYRHQPAAANTQDEIWLQDLLSFARPAGQPQRPILPPRPELGQAQIIPRQVSLDTASASPKLICWGQASQLAPELSWKLELSLAGNSRLFTLQEIGQQPLSIAYLSAQDIDSRLVAYFEQGRGALPAYLVRLQPYLLLGNELIKLGNPVKMGTPQALTITWHLPGGAGQRVDHLLLAGMNAVWAANWGQLPAYGQSFQEVQANGIKEKFKAHFNKTIRKEFYLQPLAQAALSYQQQNQRLGEIIARHASFRFAPGLSEALVALAPRVDFVFDIPLDFSCRGVQIDVQKDNFLLAAQQERAAAVKNFLALKGALASALEHRVLETSAQLSPEGSMQAVSAVKLLALSIEEGIPVYSLDSANFTEFAARLQLPSALRRDLQRALDAGKTVTLPQHVLQLDDWQGIGYIVSDKNSGSNAYLLSGGLGGGTSTAAAASSKFNFNIPYPHGTVSRLLMVLLILGAALFLIL